MTDPCPAEPEAGPRVAQEVTLVRQLAESRQRLVDLRVHREEEVRGLGLQVRDGGCWLGRGGESGLL